MICHCPALTAGRSARYAEQDDSESRAESERGGYLARLGLGEGTLIVFDARAGAAPLPQRIERSETEHAGRRFTVLRL